MITRVISGGQTGADQAGLIAAMRFGIETGGWAPKGWLIETGSAPWLGRDYGLIECSEPSWERPSGMKDWQWNAICYAERTKRNGLNSDVTLWFQFRGNSDSRGYLATRRHSRSIVNIVKDDSTMTTSTPKGLVDNFPGMLVGVVNIAGNRESRSPGIGKWVESYLAELFRILKERESCPTP